MDEVYKMTCWKTEGNKIVPFQTEITGKPIKSFQDVETLYEAGAEKLVKEVLYRKSGFLQQVTLWAKNEIGIFNPIYPEQKND